MPGSIFWNRRDDSARGSCSSTRFSFLLATLTQSHRPAADAGLLYHSLALCVMPLHPSWFAPGLLLSLSLVSCLAAYAQEWPHYGNDIGGSKYSPLKQINKQNVTRLKPAWTYHTGDISDGTTYSVRSAFECTPLVVDGVMYVSTPFCRVAALEAETGKELWSFDPKIDKERSYGLFANRGVAFWRSGRERRIFIGTLDGRLFALDAHRASRKRLCQRRMDRFTRWRRREVPDEVLRNDFPAAGL